ncbi:MAG TPA: leucyl aminopeptidase [Bacteroidales bacterium]|nr:leucyl aminopeptidase [Bacteroidales bacterium]
MNTRLLINEIETSYANKIYLVEDNGPFDKAGLRPEELLYVRRKLEHNHHNGWIEINRFDYSIFFAIATSDETVSPDIRLEKIRQSGAHICHRLNQHRIAEATIVGFDHKEEELIALAEGIVLANYQFLNHFSAPEKKKNSLETLSFASNLVTGAALKKLEVITQAVCWARHLVNEPFNALNAETLAQRFSDALQPCGVMVEVMHKNRIEALKMGGLLAVNRGSVDPPTFTVMEWKPEDALNEKPIILVGKGVVYDTGGMSLKPSNAMETMKCDMAGSAAVAAAMQVAALLNLKLHLIALAPATDNRVNGNAYVPGDVITMFDGTTVEVLNTDAEGRLILADALSYAKKYDPMLVINIATLTGSASRAIGTHGIAAMQVKAQSDFEALKVSGNKVCERLVEFPMWDEYREMLKSNIADLKNIGGPEAGMITAAKFLEHFTDYPFIHLDIAGPAFLDKTDSYRGKGGTGICVRLLGDFLVKMASVQHQN